MGVITLGHLPSEIFCCGAKSRVVTFSLSPQGGAYSRALKCEGSLSQPISVGGGAVDITDWCITVWCNQLLLTLSCFSAYWGILHALWCQTVLDPENVWPDLCPTVCKSYQQTTLVGIELILIFQENFVCLLHLLHKLK